MVVAWATHCFHYDASFPTWQRRVFCRRSVLRANGATPTSAGAWDIRAGLDGHVPPFHPRGRQPPAKRGIVQLLILIASLGVFGVAVSLRGG